MKLKWTDLEQTRLVMDDEVFMMYPTDSRFKVIIDEWLKTNEIEDFTEEEKTAILTLRKKDEALIYLRKTQQYSRAFEDAESIPPEVKARRGNARNDLE